MRRATQFFSGYKWDAFVVVATVAILVVGFTGGPSMAQQKGQKTFSSPEEAAKALYTAASANDETALLDILGPQGKDLISSGDATQDAENRAEFTKRYQQMNRLVKEPDGSVTLYIGPHNWPYPIPLMTKGNAWYFDTAAGEKEIVFRRIGRNEMSAIHISEQLAAAQKEFFTQHNTYAQQIFSEPGKQNGLYWTATGSEPQSPIGPRVAWAFVSECAGQQGGEATPFRGYYFQMLKPGSGFAFAAYPAEYRSSGVKTFVVGTDGVVYEKDLGKKTEAATKTMTTFNPDKSWQKVEMEPQQTQAASKPSSN
jgi:Protein of unknown function (DUF2950)